MRSAFSLRGDYLDALGNSIQWESSPGAAPRRSPTATGGGEDRASLLMGHGKRRQIGVCLDGLDDCLSKSSLARESNWSSFVFGMGPLPRLGNLPSDVPRRAAANCTCLYDSGCQC